MTLTERAQSTLLHHSEPLLLINGTGVIRDIYRTPEGTIIVEEWDYQRGNRPDRVFTEEQFKRNFPAYVDVLTEEQP